MPRLLPALLVVFGATLVAQSPATPLPEFDVVSVKPNVSGSFSSRTTTLPGGQFIATNARLKALVALAYRVREFQVTGGPDWIEDRYDVLARIPDASMQQQIPEMMRAMLAARFKLVVKAETREQPVFSLMRAGDRLGPDLRPSALNCSGSGSDAPRAVAGQPSPCGLNTSTGNAGGTMTGGAQSAADIAAALGGFATDRLVIDRTGLTGSFDFTLRWTSDQVRAASNQDVPSIFTAVQEQLGLKLEPARGPVEFLVVTSIERPTPD